MNQDLFELEQQVLEQADSRSMGDANQNWSFYQGLLKEYRRLLSQSRRLIRVGHTLERQRLQDLEAKNAELSSLHHAYARFVPREILDLLLKKDITQIGLGDHIEFEVSILFADIRGFTSLAETLPPERVFHFLNAYLSVVSPLIKAHNGVIDKILGDGIMAFFPQSAEDALLAALAIQTSVESFNQQWCQRELGRAIEVGIGIHQGPCILGTLGESNRMDTTVVSDAVNMASRIESLTKDYRCPILISQSIFQEAFFAHDVVFRFVDSLRLQGKQDATSLYEARPRHEASKEDLEFFDRFERAALAYHEGRRGHAFDLFQDLKTSYPSDAGIDVYLKRCGAP